MKYNLKLHLSQFLFILLLSAEINFTQNLSLVSSSQNVYPVPFTENNNFQIGSRYWTQLTSATTCQFGKAFLESCIITNIGSAFPVTFFGGLVNKGGTIYTWNQSAPFQFWSIDTVTGVNTYVFNLSGVPLAYLTGMTWDGTTMYGVSTSLSVSQLLTLNTTTGVCSPIGAPAAVCPGAAFIAGRIGVNFGLYSVDAVGDNLYRWNKATGVPNLIGPIGLDATIRDDGQFDSRDGSLYWMSTSGPTYALRKLDTSASSVLVCTYPSQGTGIAISEPSGIVSTCPFKSIFIDYNGFTKPILNSVPTRDTINVPLHGTNCYVCDINVRIDTVLHLWDSQLVFTLTHGPVTCSLITNRGGSGDNFIGTLLDDSATIPISSGTAPFTGSFRPESNLSAFNGLSPTGLWILTIADIAGGDEGYLKQWGLVISYEQCITGGITTTKIPNEFILNQNYPNPFNPTTSISFSIPKAGNVELKVYDLLGREVAVLVNEFKSTGSYSVDFDASSLSSCVYFYTIRSGDFVDSKKMVLIK